jgi:hypothetical protein
MEFHVVKMAGKPNIKLRKFHAQQKYRKDDQGKQKKVFNETFSVDTYLRWQALFPL